MKNQRASAKPKTGLSTSDERSDITSAQKRLAEPIRPVDRLLKIGEVREFLSIAEPTIWRWIAEKTFPAPLKLGRASRWRQSTIENWLEEQELKSSAIAAHSAAENGSAA